MIIARPTNQKLRPKATSNLSSSNFFSTVKTSSSQAQIYRMTLLSVKFFQLSVQCEINLVTKKNTHKTTELKKRNQTDFFYLKLCSYLSPLGLFQLNLTENK